jgi:hypothetical protein
MPRRSLCLLAASGFALPLLAGCGSDEPRATRTAATPKATAPIVGTTADRTIAGAALLRLDDLPAGWTATPQNGQARATCAAIRRLRARPRAVSPGFARDDGAGVHTVTIFPTAAEADRAFTEVVASANVSCVARSISEEARTLFAADVAVGDVIASRLDAEPLAQRTEAIRFTLPLRRRSMHARLFQDYVYTRVGRGLSIVWLRWQFTRPDDRLRASLAATAVRRLRAALAGSGR